jgi:hypothetical protein
MSIMLNGFQVEFSQSSFTTFVREAHDPKLMRQLRDDFAADWFLHYRGGHAYGVPLKDTPSKEFGAPLRLTCAEHMGLAVLAARINDALPGAFPDYEAFRRRPFAFLARKTGDEIVEAVASKMPNKPPLLSKFKIRPKYELDARLVEFRNGQTAIGLIMSVDMRWEINASLHELQLAGINLVGQHAVRRNPGPDERRLVGRIGCINGERVELSESYDEVKEVGVNEIWLEPAPATFFHCLKHILGNRFKAFDDAREAEGTRFLTGPSYDRLLDTMDKVLRKVSPLALAPDLTCSFTGRLRLTNSASYQTVVNLGSPEYCFDAAKSKRERIAWAGLERFGPFSRDSFARKSPKILVICPDSGKGKVEQFIRHFRDGITSLPNSAYPSGFGRTFDLANPEFPFATVPLLTNRSVPVHRLYREAVETQLRETQGNYDAAILVIPDEHSAVPDKLNPYLHAKSLLLMAGIPVQAARLSKITAQPYELTYTCRNFSIGLYAKLGGTPWTVDHDKTVSDELVIGMGSCEMSGSRFETRQRHIGITTAFRGDGSYVLSNLSKECPYDQYPAVLKASTLEVLREVKRDHGWRRGDTIRIVFHASKRLRNVEVAEIVAQCVREVGDEQQIEFAFLSVLHDHPFKLLDKAQQGVSKRNREKIAVYVPNRGVLAQLGAHTRLLCTNGPSLIKRTTSPLPAPLLVKLHEQSTYVDQTYLGEQVLKFTSLSWRSTLPAQTAVTIYYSELIAKMLAKLKTVPDWSPATLNVKLRASKWFL